MMYELSDNKQPQQLVWITIIYLVVLNVHSFFLEPTFVSPVKVGLMALAPLVFIWYVPKFTSAVFWGGLYVGYCFLTSYLHGNMRFSTIGYLGMFVVTFIVYYNLINQQILAFNTFKKVISYLIYAFAICLLLEQVCLIVGINNFPLINLLGNMKLGKLPSLCLEPSHTAVVMTFAYLSYLRCCQVEIGEKLLFKDLVRGEHRWVTLSFLWVMLTMGSGSAYFGLMGLAFYFVNKKNAFWLGMMIVVVMTALPYVENEQVKRVSKITSALTTGDTYRIVKADGSGASRIVPLLNTFTQLDLTKMETWFGHGTLSQSDSYNKAWKDLTSATYYVIPIVRQYGLIGWFISLLLVFQCCIRRVVSVETLLWFTLGMATLGNVYFHWGIIMMMAGVKYYQQFADDIYNERQKEIDCTETNTEINYA